MNFILRKEIKMNLMAIKYKMYGDFSRIKRLSIPECPRPSVFEKIYGLINHDKAKNLHIIVEKKHKELGAIYRDHIGPVTAIFVNSPEIYKKIFRCEGNIPQHLIPEAWLLYNEIRQSPRGLIFMNGNEWLYHRRIMNKLLLSSNNTQNIITNACQDAVSILISKWQNDIKQNQVINNLATQLYQLSIEVMIATLIGSKWQQFIKTTNENELKKLTFILHRIFELSGKLSMMPAKYAMKFKLPVWNEFVQVFDLSFSIIHKLVINMIKFQGDGLLNLMEKEGIEKENLFRIISDLILAAGDTTAYSTQWALFLLAKHSNVQNEILKRLSNKIECKQLIGDLYMKGVMKETLRLYPVAPFLTRILPQDCITNDYLIPKGELILLSLYSSGRDLKNFPEPNEFKPERWLRDNKGNLLGVDNAYGSIPFALGARSCVGKKFAEIQFILTIIKIVENFNIKCFNSNKIKIILNLISVPSENIQLKLSSRNG